MGTSAGPSLQGIGRGGDSNLVLEMDAHDAKSYPGEPTENLLTSSAMDFSVLSTYTGSTFTQVADGESPTGYACEMYYTGTVNDSSRCRFGASTNVPTSGTAFATIWVKRTAGDSASMRPSLYTGYAWYNMDPLDGGGIYITSEYRPFGKAVTLGTNSSGPNPGFSMTHAGSTTASDKTRWIMPQLTTKSYATPFVREGKGGTGTYNARPASTNLMIHGNVGTGQTFSDSSPSKHTITANGNTTHSGTQSKFNGGSIYFDGTGDYLNVADSTDWEFSNGVFTIDFWYKNNSTANNRGVISIASSSQSNYESILVYTGGSATTLVLYSSSGGTIWDIASAAAMGAFGSDWTHYAIVRESVAGDIKLYNNGTLIDVVSTSATLRAVDTFRIGQRVSESNGASCYLDEIRITKGTALWTAAFTPPTRRNLSAPVVDRSGNDNGGNFNTTDMTDVATYRVGEVIRPIDSAVWDFDGTDDQVRIGSSSSYNNTLDKTVAMWISAGSGVGGLFSAICTNRLGGDQEVNLSLYLDDRKVVRTWNPSGTDEMVLIYSVGNGTSSFFTWSKEKLGTTTGDNLWHYVVGVTDVSQNKIFLYYDGYNVHSTTISGTIDTPSADLRLGSGYGPTDSTSPFTGKISAFRVYNKRLTDQQIVENFNQQRSRFNI